MQMTKGARAALGGLVVLAAGAAMTGCVPVAVVGGAVGAGTLLMTADRRSGETQDADRTIEAAAQEAVVRALPGRGHVNITSYYRKVLLTGEVPTAQDRQLVASVVAAVPGQQGVINDLAVMPDSSAINRSNDGLLTSKVRTRLLQTNGVPVGSIRVLTERGTTYLMGRLTPFEANLATEVARQTDGVQRVVRVIDHIADPAGAQIPATAGTATQVSPTTGSVDAPAAAGVVVQPVTQPTIVNAPQPIQVQTLPPAK